MSWHAGWARFASEVRYSGKPGRADNPIAAVLWMTLSMVLLAGLSATAKYAGQHGVHPLELVFLRNLSCVLWMLPMLAWRGPELFASKCMPLYGLRAGINVVSMWCWFGALALIPLAELQATGFLAPLFATVFAIFYLGERVSRTRWMALVVGLFGALVILRPWGVTFGTGQLLALCAAASLGIVSPLVKQLTASDDPDKIVFITNLILVPMSVIPALFVWSWPAVGLWPCLLGMGACAFLGHIAMVRAFNSADASLVATFDFSRLPIAVLIGTFVFGETTDLWTWAGAIIIFTAAFNVTRAEARGGRTIVWAGEASDPVGLTPISLRLGRDE